MSCRNGLWVCDQMWHMNIYDIRYKWFTEEKKKTKIKTKRAHDSSREKKKAPRNKSSTTIGLAMTAMNLVCRTPAQPAHILQTNEHRWRMQAIGYNYLQYSALEMRWFLHAHTHCPRNVRIETPTANSLNNRRQRQKEYIIRPKSMIKINLCQTECLLCSRPRRSANDSRGRKNKNAVSFYDFS